MMRSEITVSMYRACVNAGICEELTSYEDYDDYRHQCNWSTNVGLREDHPINCISYVYCGPLQIG